MENIKTPEKKLSPDQKISLILKELEDFSVTVDSISQSYVGTGFTEEELNSTKRRIGELIKILKE